jgi:hypothetical protein
LAFSLCGTLLLVRCWVNWIELLIFMSFFSPIVCISFLILLSERYFGFLDSVLSFISVVSIYNF